MRPARRPGVCAGLRRVFAILLVIAAPGAAAELRTFLEPRLIDEMDTVRLTIRAEGTSQTDAPDLTPLMDDFEVLGNQTSSRISSVNGRTLASVEYQITLRPRRTGTLMVPSLQIGNDRSEEIELAVRPLDPELKNTIANMVFFESELSSNPVYVQAETVLTRRLFYSQGVQIYSDLPGVPEVENAVVIPLGETQSRSVVRGGQRYGVIEQHFALFPETSGSVFIPAISVTSSVRLQSGGRTRRSGIRVGTERIELEVLPIPASYPADAAWLPATDVVLAQRWRPPTSRIKVGEPLRYELDVAVQGNRGSAIPPVPLPLPADQFKVYPSAPEMEERADSGTVVGQRSTSYALIPTAPGRVQAPDISISWWDTVGDRLMNTSIPISALEITGTPAPPVQPSAPVAEGVTAGQTDAVGTGIEAESAGLLRAAAALLALGLVGLFVWAGRRFGIPHLKSAGHTIVPGNDARRLLRELKAASASGDPAVFRHRLGDYLAAVCQSTPHEALALFRRDPEVAVMLRDLDRAIYAPDRAAVPDLDGLLARARVMAGKWKISRAEDPLPALYS